MVLNDMEGKIAIVGGGISGLATALALKRIGLTVSIYEKKAENSRTGSGIVLGSNALRALDYLGVLPQIQERGISSNQYFIFDNHGKPITTLHSEQTVYPLYTFIHRKDLIDILLNALSDEHIFYKKKLVFFTTNHKKSQLFFEDGTIVKTDYLLACDGIHSAIRNQLFPDKHLRYAGYTCWRGVLENSYDHCLPFYSETWGAKGRFGIIPLTNNRLYWYALKNGEPNDTRLHEWGTDELLSNFSEYHHPIPTIIENTLDKDVTRRDIYDLESLFHYVYDRILLLGDAAHATTPNLGQGACLAIEDAVFLAKCAEQDKHLETAMTSFEKIRLARTKKVVHESWMFGKIAQIDIPFICSVRNMVMKWTPASFHQSRLQVLQNLTL
ncbi:FAD-dependent oxidoreductase [Pseudoneobacillus rhizosphaerae]|uniref:Aurachin C monooxygenase/isomerase n=1 Tax=Pseudoneobacillus rhizosphaerae TaxID=2880968 RepID=A0A9C7GC72_9BACI|nr:FAD-dependent oxidoreductase [Pseudoneobacillus rhizosphaerae]CAG9609701.1 Aurachin C monooxygenase/isomerase [Pseudoneobacillus rhizosphaerae]